MNVIKINSLSFVAFKRPFNSKGNAKHFSHGDGGGGGVGAEEECFHW